jgi:hypothetical protein
LTALKKPPILIERLIVITFRESFMNTSVSATPPVDFSEQLQSLGEDFVFMAITTSVLMLVSLAITIWGLIVLMNSMSAVPEKHRRMAPGLVWLNIIPCFSLVWSWFLAIWIPDSLRAAFKEASIEGVPDGRVKGVAYAISLPVFIVLSFCAGLFLPLLPQSVPDISEGETVVVMSSSTDYFIIQLGLSLIPLILFILFFLEVKSAATRLRAVGEGA